ncbi:MAG TPA: alanine racemase [Mycobacteriales bacterium]|jgi:D-serine deaminase-like pyridoxal phosphate-dependent protein|nr:alanine racemase [Mycobacteriales bacterium]
MQLSDLPTPAIVVDEAALERNLTTMSDARPGAALRPHVKAHKTTELARRQYAHGHHGFTLATVKECVGMAAAGLGDDLLLANEVLDMTRLGEIVEAGARVTVAVDSEPVIRAAVAGGVREVLIDVNVGLPRCGCAPDDAGSLADLARSLGLSVRGVMGYEGHLMLVEDTADRARQTEECMALLLAAHADVGGDIVSGGGTGTWQTNRWVTELQAGSYALMDTAYAAVPDVPFEQSLHVLATVISVNPGGWAVVDAGLKAFGMDHGNPSIAGTDVWYCSDEHTVFSMQDGAPLPAVGDRFRMAPAHIDPTCSLHERMHLVDADGEVLETWPIDLRNW